MVQRALVGERLVRRLCVAAADASQFARLSGDQNPIHHDAEHARRTRFGGVVLSGPQLASLLMGMSATHFSRPGPAGARAMLGLDFRFRFRRAVLADTPFELRWDVVAVRAKPSLGGDVVFLAGRVRDAAGADAVKAAGKVLVLDAL
jgi:acyl dehydratase